MIVITLLIMCFRLYSSINKIYTMADPGVQKEINTPYNKPMLKPGTYVDLIGHSKSESIDIGYAITGELYPWGRVRISRNDSVLITGSDSLVELRFQLPGAFMSLSGIWRGDNSRLAVFGEKETFIEGIPGNKDKTWGNSILGMSSEVDEADPYFDIIIPINPIEVNSTFDERKMNVHAEMDIYFPAPTGAASYNNISKKLVHEFKILVLTPEEANEYHLIKKEYFQSRLIRLLLIWGAIICGEFLLLLLTNFLSRILK